MAGFPFTSVAVVAGNDILIADLNSVRTDLIQTLQDAQVAGETINGATLPVASFLQESDGEWYACDANDNTKLNFGGFAITNGVDAGAITIQISGIVAGFTSLTLGARYYVQDDKTIGTAVGTITIFVGTALSTTEILINGELQAHVADTFVSVLTNGVTTRSLGSASGTQTIAHGLGVIPKKVIITAKLAKSTNTTNAAVSNGVYNGTTNSCVFVDWDTNGGHPTSGNSATQIAYIDYGANQADRQTAIATFDDTNITLTWTKVGSGSGTIHIMWEAEA